MKTKNHNPLRRRFAWLVCLTLLLPACATDVNTDQAEEMVGENLTWTPIGAAPWQISGAEYSASGDYEGFSFLVTNETFSNYQIDLEFWIDEGTNSGVFVRCPSPERVSPITCYEINIWDSHNDPNSRTGAIVTHIPPSAFVETVGEWNTMQIVAVDNRITVTINGQLTADLENDAHTSGHVALQFGSPGGVKFRNVTLETR